jgi:DNA-binding CsgD family transcriptional regulator
LQEARIARLRSRAEYAQRRDRHGQRDLLAAAQLLEPLDPALARDTYMEALAAALFGGRLGDPGLLTTVAEAILQATAGDDSDRARDLILRGQALLAVQGLETAIPTLRRALHAFAEQSPDALELRWMWFGCRAAIDLWDRDALRQLGERQVELARGAGVLTILPVALTYMMAAHVLDGRLDLFEAACDEVDAIRNVTGHQLPQYGRLIVAAYRGRVEEVERRASQLRADAEARGEGNALSAINSSLAIAYNGAGRYPEALAAAREELAYTHELSFSIRALPEVVEAGVRTGDRAVAEEALEHLGRVTRPPGGDWGLGVLALAEAQLCKGEEAENLYRQAVERFERGRMPLLEGRARVLYGEALRWQDRRADARAQLRAAYELLSRCGATGFARRAADELSATGEVVRTPIPEAMEELTDQELNVARLAREGLTNREIGARLFISARTAEYHLRKVFIKLGITSRAELTTAPVDLG